MSSVETQALAAPPMMERREETQAGTRAIVFALVLMVVCGFGLRVSGISAIGFAEDEINKVEAVRAYGRGDIRPNAEHPMLMKSLTYVSMQTARALNERLGGNQISDEAALRFPNILVGSLTVLPMFLLTAGFFDRRTALIAAALWAFGINAITYNRIAKEDTLLVFFMLFAFYFYLRAKQTSGHDAKGKRWYYGLSGISFGLMLASKYFPHYFGLNALYHHLVRVRERLPDEPAWRTPKLFYLLMLGVFILANPAVLLPQTWAYLQSYTSGQLLTHTGYLMGETLYKNTMSSTPFWGTPIYFYLLFLAIKVPLPVTIALVIGLVRCVKRWRHPGHAFLLLMFVLWIVPYSLIGAKWLRYTLSLMPFVYMIAAVGIMAVVEGAVARLREKGLERATILAASLILLVFIGLPAWAAYAHSPHYALYTNALGRERAGYYFPHDEFYDDGLREAIRYVSDNAPLGATIVHETPGVVAYYLEEFGRSDLQSKVLSDAKFNVLEAPKPCYVIIQPGRTYFENQTKIDEIRAQYPKVYEVRFLQGISAAEVYEIR